MAYKSKFTGAKVDELLTAVQTQQDNPSSILNKLTERTFLINSLGKELSTRLIPYQGISYSRNMLIASQVLEKLLNHGK